MRRPAAQHGFTLVELLVVILLIGILVAIALPMFLGQRSRAQDVEAQTTIHTVVTALAVHETEQGTFDATRAELEQVEPSIAEASPELDVDGSQDAYAITERSRSGTAFTFARDAVGRVTRTCAPAERGRCDATGSW